MQLLRNLAFYLAFYGGSVFFVLAALIAHAVTPARLRPIADGWSRWHHFCVETILGIEVKVTGVPPAGPALYAIKHESLFEAIALPVLFDNPAGFAKQELFAIPGWGSVARAYGIIPVAREEGARTLRAMLQQARPYIEAGRPIIIFPEGTRVPHGTRPALQSGFAALYKMLRLPVIPVAVNSGPVYQRKWKRRGTIRVHFGEPVPPGLPRAEAEARVHAAINALNAPAARQPR